MMQAFFVNEGNPDPKISENSAEEKPVDGSGTPEKELTKNICGDGNNDFDYDYPPIEESFEGEIVKRSIAEQYFESRYCNSDNDDYCVLFHSNRICIVTLAKSHSIIQQSKDVTKIEFKQTTVGKKKHKLYPNTVVCVVHCSDGTRYKVRALVSGKLMEINNNLLTNPHLLIKEPMEEGYLFIILPSISDYEDFKKKYMSAEEYNRKIASS